MSNDSLTIRTRYNDALTLSRTTNAISGPLLSASGRLIFPSQARMLYERYGFQCRSESDALPSRPSASPYATLEVRTAARRLGINQPLERSRATVIQILGCYNQLIDRDQVHARNDVYIAYAVQNFKFVERAYADGGRAFILTEHGAINTKGPVVIVYDPLVALALYRTARLSDVRDVMGVAVRLGARFNLARAIPNNSPPMTTCGRKHVCTQGHRYASYVRCRDAFVRSERGHVAIKAGGLMARLAVGTVKPDDIYNGAIAGGDRKIAMFGWYDLYDGSLSRKDVSVLCGVHYTRPWSRELSSWWPTPDVWAGCRLEREFWTPEAEDWFIGWRDQLERNAIDRAPTKTEWRERLRPVSAASRHLMDGCREHAYRFMTERM
ncbi:unnamed protein product [Cyclocybe aegerita]|uniref:Uncharacterized protein n=1 Tax=Cyclocybe aegerita TaxID=1973307 RepID=A0A8S0WLX8_CYCAE|nr:unnamed protein product [Cyclocybe aegerita]